MLTLLAFLPTRKLAGVLCYISHPSVIVIYITSFIIKPEASIRLLKQLQKNPRMEENNTKVAPQTEGSNKSQFIGFRATSDELAKIDRLAAQCGMNRSDYLRMVATGHEPRQRLTDRELTAIDTLEGCRKQTQQFLNRVDGMTDNQRKQLFRDPAYYKQWKAYVDATVLEWTNIRKNLKQKG